MQNDNQPDMLTSGKDEAGGANPSPSVDLRVKADASARPSTPSAGFRWNLRRIMCFSHDGRRRDVELVPGEVNIITGNSHTGKSALAELIDYVMGASECNLPRRVFNTTSWVGLVWEKAGTQCLICRRVPERRPGGSDDLVYQVGADIVVPESSDDLIPTFGRDGMLKRFEALLGIGDAKTEVFGSETNRPVRVSFRNAIPYLLQDGTHIINPIHLLRGQDTRQRQHLIDTVPYYLGAVDESIVLRESELRQLRARISLEERRQAERNAIVGQASATARALLGEALDIGLLAEPLPPDAPDDDVHTALEVARERTLNAPEPFAADIALAQLYEQEQQLSAAGSRIRARIEATRRTLAAADGFDEAGTLQLHRLEVVNLIPDGDDGVCPLCVQPVRDRVQSPQAVRQAAVHIRSELAEVDRERPRLDGVLAELEEERGRMSRSLSEIRAEIARSVQASEERQRLTAVDRQRLLLAGKISLYLQTAVPATPAVATGPADLESLREREELLMAELNTDARLEALTIARMELSTDASEIAQRLPLEADYAGEKIDVNLRTLTVSIGTPPHREEMRSIGSDENYLTLHVAVLLAFHRIFARRQRPVPGFLLFDQLSRPYYPPDPLSSDQREEEVTSDQPEVASLKRYFDVLFDETARGGGLQVLVLEHAYFSDDPRFTAATRERWIHGEALIPEDWPARG